MSMETIRLRPGATSGEVARVLAQAPEGATLCLSPETYSFGMEGVFRGVFAPSNNDTGEKRVVFPLIGKKRLRIDGRGAVLSFTERLFPFILQDCEDVVLENFTIDFTFPRYAAAEVLRADAEALTLRVDAARFPFRVENGGLAFQAGSEWRTTAKKKFFLAPLNGRGGFRYLAAGETADPLYNLAAPLLRTDASRTEDGAICLRYREGSSKADYEAGQRILVSHDENRENDLFFLERCRNVTIRNVRILRGAGMGMIGQLCHDLTFENIAIETEPTRDEPVSITADAFHFLHCSGKLEIRGCTVRDTLDDAVNIHGIYTQVERVNGSGAVVRLGHQEQYGFNPYLPGDRVSILNGQGEGGRLTVRAAERSEDGKSIALTFEEDAREKLKPGDYLDNPDRMPEMLLENNRFLNCPRVLLGSPRRTVVRGNELRLHGTVTVTGGVDYWFESGMARDVRIENNDLHTLPGRSHPAVRIETKGENRCHLFHQNIAVEHNRLFGFSDLLNAEAAENLRIAHNTSDAAPCELHLRGCRNVCIVD